MRLPDPLTVPAGPGFKTASLTSKTYGMSHQLNGAALVTVRTVGQSWEIALQYNTMTHEQFAPIDGFLESLGGNMTAFTVVLPQYRQLGISDKTISGVSNKDITLDNVTGMSVGNIIQFDNSAKVYKIVAINSNTITLNTEPYSVLNIGNTAKLSDIEFRCKLEAAPTIVTNDNNLIEGFALTLKETIL